MKMSKKKKLVEEFLSILIRIWEQTISHNSYEERETLLNSPNLLEFSEYELDQFSELDNYGDYSIEFLVLLAKLLMQQEKNNRKDAFMFRKLLESLRKGEDIFDIVSRASYRGRKK